MIFCLSYVRLLITYRLHSLNLKTVGLNLRLECAILRFIMSDNVEKTPSVSLKVVELKIKHIVKKFYVYSVILTY